MNDSEMGPGFVSSPWFRWPAVLCAGAVLPLAYAPWGWFWVAPLAYAVLFLAWRGTTPRRAFRLGFAFGAASFLSGVHWVYISVAEFGNSGPLLATLLTAGLVIVLACFVGAAGAIAARWFETRGAAARLATLPATFLLTEWCRGWLFSGFGWLSAGYSQTDSWLMAYAPLFGLHGIGWAVLVTAGALLGLAAGGRRERTVAALVLAALWIGARVLDGQRWTAPSGNVLSVAVVQGAVPQQLKWDPAQLAATLALYQRLTEASLDSQLIVWPEAAIPALYEDVEPYLTGIRAMARQRDSVVVLGILRGESIDSFQNTVAALTDPPAFYAKRHLVPFGEYFPVPDFVRRWMRLQNLPYIDATPGSDDQPPLELLGERIAVTICYEDVFGAEQLGFFPAATLMVNVSNDAWFGDSIAPHQHLQIARLRAAEVGRYLLRSTNTGISAIIDPRGRVVARSPQFEPHTLQGAVQGFTGATPYVRWGNYPVVLGALLVLLSQLPVTKLTMRRGT